MADVVDDCTDGARDGTRDIPLRTEVWMGEREISIVVPPPQTIDLGLDPIASCCRCEFSQSTRRGLDAPFVWRDHEPRHRKSYFEQHH